MIDTIGLRDDTWIDWNGSVLTEAAKVRDTDLIDEICLENEKLETFVDRTRKRP